MNANDTSRKNSESPLESWKEAKSQGASADVADKITRQLAEDFEPVRAGLTKPRGAR